MEARKLLVGSVFANDAPDQQRWLDLQLRYLAATTENYAHIAVVSEGLTNEVFQSKTSVLIPGNTSLTANNAHLQGLNLLLKHFHEVKDAYDYFLFIDADAFPIRQNWLGTLLNKMQPDDASIDETGNACLLPVRWRDYEIACCLRSENLETRLHASVLFVKKDYLPFVDFKIAEVGLDLCGNPEEDIHLPTYQFGRRELALPLIRTNQYNIHPLACGVYLDMFYHHACGSGRPFNLRAADFYLQKIIRPIDDVSAFTRQLMEDPNGFIRKLAGWNNLRYGVV